MSTLMSDPTREDELAATLAARLRAGWESRRLPSQPGTAAWLGGDMSPKANLNMLIQDVLAPILLGMRQSWWVQVDCTKARVPQRLLVVAGDQVRQIKVKVSTGAFEIARHIIPLGAHNAGELLIGAITKEVASALIA